MKLMGTDGGQRVLGAVALVVALSGAAGCQAGSHGGGADGAASPPSAGGTVSPSAGRSPQSPTPSWTGVAAPPEALAAYDAMWEDIMAVSQTSAYTDPRIATHMMGKPLTFWTEQLAKDQSEGKVSKGRLVWKPTVTSVSPSDAPNRVEVADCLDSSQWQHYTTSGQLVADAGGGRHRSAAAITKRWDGSWVVSEQLIGEVGTC